MPHDALRELLDLSAVHSFFLSVLERRLGHTVPPHEVKPKDSGSLAPALRAWLDVLDLATTPVMMRDALQQSPAREALEALLRMYIVRASALDADRDKTDFLVTYLYRNPPRCARWWRSCSRSAARWSGCAASTNSPGRLQWCACAI